MTPRCGRALVAATLILLSACAARPVAPAVSAGSAFRDLPLPAVPATLKAPPEIVARHLAAWRRLQSGDTGRAVREFTEILRLSPDFYPSSTALGVIAALDRRYDEAARRFDAAIALAPTYVPALSGRLDLAVTRGEPAVALRTAEALLAAAPDRDDVRAQLDLLRLRVLQGQLARASAARTEGRLDEAQAALDEALAMLPESAVVLREVAQVEIVRGHFDAAEEHARRSLVLDPGDAETHVVLATVLEAQGRLREAAEALARAISIDPRAEWRERAEAVKARADYDAFPAEYRAIPDSATVTRGQLAAILGIRLSAPLARSPRRVAVVLTDVRSHWATSWILPVTRAGWIEPFANHTFQPSGVVRRADLAQVLWRVAQDLAAGQPAELSRWRASRPLLADVPRGHLAYGAIAGALASGTLVLGAGDRFQPNRPATGAELVQAIARLEQLARQWGVL